MLLVPLLNATLGLSIPQAAAIGNVGVLATAGSVAVSSATRQRLNVRLAITLLVFSVGGAMFGASLLRLLDDNDYKREQANAAQAAANQAGFDLRVVYAGDATLPYSYFHQPPAHPFECAHRLGVRWDRDPVTGTDQHADPGAHRNNNPNA